MGIVFCAYALLLSAYASSGASWRDLTGAPHDPFAGSSRAHVFVFLRTDCPLANRYAPELNEIARRYAGRAVDFWLVYPDRRADVAAAREQMTNYGLPGTPLLDPKQKIVQLAGATISPEAAVFDHARHLTYVGRIDDRVTGFGSSRPEPTTHDLEEAIGKTLEGKAVARSRTRAFGCYLADLK